MWGGRFSAMPDQVMEAINASIDVDKRLAEQDIAGSKAHAAMLAHVGIISAEDEAARLSCLTLWRHEPHRWARGRLADSFCIGGIIFLPLHKGLHILRRHQLHLVPQCSQLTRPVMGRGAGFHANKAGRQLLEQLQQLPTRQPAPQHCLALRVDTVNLENRLCQIQPNNRYLLHRHSPLLLVRRN